MIVIANPSEHPSVSLKSLLFAPHQEMIELHDRRELFRFCLENEPDLVIGVIGDYPLSIVDVAEEVRDIQKKTHFVFLVDEADEETLYQAMELGLCISIANIVEWGTYQLAHQNEPTYEPLTKREKEVLKLMSEGMTNQDIADTLFISLKTVKSHVSNILSKLNVEDRTQAAVFALKHHLV